MRIVIVGGGVVGYGLAGKLLKEKHQLSLIELDSKLCAELSEKLDMQIINGSGTSPELLKQAYFVYTLRSVTLVCVFFGIYFKRAHPDAAFWSIILGFVAATLYQFNIPINYKPYFWNMHVAIFTVVIAIPVFVIISLVKKWTPQTAGEVPPLYKKDT